MRVFGTAVAREQIGKIATGRWKFVAIYLIAAKPLGKQMNGV